MTTRIFFLLLIITVLSSCDRRYRAEGRVLDNETAEPIEGVKVAFLSRDSTLTDSSGFFKIEGVFLGGSPDFELLFKKKGYKSSFADIDNDYQNTTDNIEIVMNKSHSFKDEIYNTYLVSFFYNVNLILSFLNLITLFFLIFSTLRFKYIWIIALIMINLSFHVNIINGHIDFGIINFFIKTKHYSWNPYTMKIYIPLTSLAFWTIYFSKTFGIKKFDKLFKS